MKRLIVMITLSLFVLVGMAQADIIHQARRASVQPVLYMPVIMVYFTDPIEVTKPLEQANIEKIIHERIEMAIEAEREYQAKPRHSKHLTAIDKYIKPTSKTFIPLAQLCPEGVKFPERILVVYKTKKDEITAWDEKHEKDVLNISEIAGVSISQAQSILSRLRGDGYTISKETIDETTEIKIMWYDDGWNDTYPIPLAWSVSIEGYKENLITGYDSRGIILLTNPIPEDKRVRVQAGYLDLLPEFKPKSNEVLILEGKIETTEKELDKVKEQLKEATEKEPEKRDISNATIYDVAQGTVTLKRFWVKSAASGVFLGNMRVLKEMQGYSWRTMQHVEGQEKGVILTNAHVVSGMLSFTIYVSKDKERMWILYPATPFVRYTSDTKGLGSPANLLFLDSYPVYSFGVDAALLVTTTMPGYNKYKALLGDSSRINEGDPVAMVGNPASFQKFSTKGIIANTNYDLFNTSIGDRILDEGISRAQYEWIRSSSLWFDCPIGTGGTSGSGVWALSGSQKGKVIALHNMGLAIPTSMTGDKSNEVDVDLIPSLYGKIKVALRDQKEALFADLPIGKARFSSGADSFLKDYPEFLEAFNKHGGYVDVSGMNAGIPINKIKAYLQERGLNPANFGWEGLTGKYWVK